MIGNGEDIWNIAVACANQLCHGVLSTGDVIADVIQDERRMDAKK